MGIDTERKPFLLHLCCAPCAPHPLRELKKRYRLTLYFYNPNIHPEAEYRMRLEEVRKLADIEGLPLAEGEYRPDEWFAMTRELADEPEKGRRCELCISERLEKTARKAADLGIAEFGTVLSVSPHKDILVINRAGRTASAKTGNGGPAFLEADFKKKDGFKISSRISKELGFVRQDYCGCVYSRRDRPAKKHATSASAHINTKTG